MEEFVEMIDENGSVLKIISRREAHKKGLLHKVVHVCITNSKRQILLQKRSSKKKLYPSVWDIACAGHVGVGEKSIEGAIREAKEELGIELKEKDLEFAFSFLDDLSNGEYKVVEIADVFVVKKDVELRDIKTQADEVDEVKWVSFEEFAASCMDDTFCPHKKGFEKLIKYLKEIKD